MQEKRCGSLEETNICYYEQGIAFKDIHKYRVEDHLWGALRL
jgi:hypothetical protein